MSDPRPRSRPWGVGLVGAGLIGREHLQALTALAPRTRLIGVADPIVDRARSAVGEIVGEVGGLVVPDPAPLMARDDIEILVVATPPSAHEGAVCAALEAGKHVICEKPVAPSLAAADRIAAVASRASGRLGVVYQLRDRPDLRRAKFLVDHGLLGRLSFGHFYRMSKFAGSAAGGNGWWGRWDIAGGGVVMTQFIHELDLMIHLMGRPVRVMAAMDTRAQTIASEDTFSASITFESGAIATCGATLGAQQSRYGFDVIGSRASLHGPWDLRCGDAAHTQAMAQALDGVFDGQGLGTRPHLHTAYWSGFLDALDAGRPAPVDLAAARASLALCLGIYESAIRGQPVALPLTPDHRCYGGVTAALYETRVR